MFYFVELSVVLRVVLPFVPESDAVAFVEEVLRSGRRTFPDLYVVPVPPVVDGDPGTDPFSGVFSEFLSFGLLESVLPVELPVPAREI
ncbi:MAG: hypothetical protein K0S12_511 [Bacteroidetes bacterium]|jgi:hypothetical protein|nr:hypothetical protein [Bacteroidota bacterium]